MTSRNKTVHARLSFYDTFIVNKLSMDGVQIHKDGYSFVPWFLHFRELVSREGGREGESVFLERPW